MIGKQREIHLDQFKKPSSQMTSEDLEKIFKESEIYRSHFFPKEVPCLSIKETSMESSSNQKIKDAYVETDKKV